MSICTFVDRDELRREKADGGDGWDEPFLEAHHSRALVGEDGLVRVHTGVELIAELPRLNDGAGVACDNDSAKLFLGRARCSGVPLTVVEEVKAAVYPETVFKKLRGRGPGRQWFLCGRHFQCIL